MEIRVKIWGIYEEDEMMISLDFIKLEMHIQIFRPLKVNNAYKIAKRADHKTENKNVNK